MSLQNLKESIWKMCLFLPSSHFIRRYFAVIIASLKEPRISQTELLLHYRSCLKCDVHFCRQVSLALFSRQSVFYSWCAPWPATCTLTEGGIFVLIYLYLFVFLWSDNTKILQSPIQSSASPQTFVNIYIFFLWIHLSSLECVCLKMGQ
jgi:hypothetical protein